MSKKVKIGVISTSWWADAMYLPALTNHPQAQVEAVCGRDQSRADAFAQRWDIPQVFTDYREMINTADLDAVIVASSNKSHHPITMAALEKNLHVLCEKPLAMTANEAAEMAVKAGEKQLKTLVPYTYRYMPTNRYLKRLIDDGYLGRPYHLAMRYYANYGRDGGYMWRFNKSLAGSGVIGDLGSHFLYLARWYFGEVTAVTCQTGRFVERPSLDPEGRPYEPLEDSAYFLLEFANGAQASIHVTCVAHEETPFGQRHFMEFHGSDGTLYMETDWINRQEVHGAKMDGGKLETLTIPDEIWGAVNREFVPDTYRDVFRKELRMTGDWVSAIAHDTPVEPNFEDGLAIQKIMSAAVQSAAEKRQVSV